jgi:hypothetical protein
LRYLALIAAGTLSIIFFIATVAPANAAAASSIAVSPARGIVGTKIMISGQGYPPDAQLKLEWSSVNASWEVSGNPTQVMGLSAMPSESVIASVETDALGSFSTNLTAPSDYGGQHVLQALAANGTSIPGRALFTLEPSFHISPASGPAGTPIEVTASGLGYGEYSTSYHLYWDNSYVGYFTAISTRGTTNFTIYASGAPGAHYVEVYQGYPGPAYLNPQQGPPSSETQSIFPPYIPFNAEFNMTVGQSSGSLNLPGSMLAPSLGILAAALVAGGVSVTFMRSDSIRRKGVTRTLVVVIVIIVVGVAGMAAYVGLSPGAAKSTTENISFTPQATVDRPAIAVPQNEATAGPRISVSPEIASVGQTVSVTGAGFAPNTPLALQWSTEKGSNLLGYGLVAEPLRNVTSNAEGAFSFPMKVPPDLGGFHYISAGDLTPDSNGTLFLQRTASINATQGPAGTVVAITMLGVGWTFNTNIAALDYDNSYLGYGCGFNSGGNVTFYLTVTGAPGVQTIDIYPSIWWGTSSYYNQSAVEYRYPLLTPQDHPQLMPSFHFTFLITSPSQHSPSNGDILTAVSPLGLVSFAVGGIPSSGSVGALRPNAKLEWRS